MSTGVFVVVMLVLAVSGYRYGLGVLFGRLMALSGGYLSAFFFVHQAEAWLVIHSSTKGLDAWVLAAGACFIAGYFVTGITYRLLKTLLGSKKNVLSTQSRLTGAVLGCAMGVVLGVIAVWLVGMKQDMALANTVSGKGVVQWGKPDAVRQLSDQTVAKIAKEIMRVVGHAEPATMQASANVIGAPVRVSAGLRQLANAPEFRAWLEDPQTQEMMARADIEQLMQSKNFQALTNAPENMDALRVLQGAPTASSHVVARQFAETSADVWQKIQRVKSNPEFQRLASDPEIVRLAQEPNAVQMMRSGKVRALVELVFNGNPAAHGLSDAAAINDGATQRSQPPPIFDGTSGVDTTTAKPAEIIYQWKDADGRTQFGDQPPSGALNVKQIK